MEPYNPIQNDGNRTQYLFDYVNKFSEIYFIIMKLIAEQNIETAKLTLINQILYSKGYRNELNENGEDADRLARELSTYSIFRLQAIYANEMRKLGVGPAIQFYSGSSYFDKISRRKYEEKLKNMKKE